MPRPMQIWNHYRNQWMGAYWQSKGITVIPTVGWSDEQSFDFCFDGVPREATVTISTFGCWRDKIARDLFMKGYERMLEVLNPQMVLVYGTEKHKLEGNVVYNEKLDGAFEHVFRLTNTE